MLPNPPISGGWRFDPHVAVPDALDERLRLGLAIARRLGEQTRRLRFDSNVLERDRRTVGCQQLYRKLEIGIDPASTPLPIRGHHTVFDARAPVDDRGIAAPAAPVAAGARHARIFRRRLPLPAGIVRVDRNEDLRETG